MAEIDSHTLYPSMMKNTYMLIIDHNTFRFHSMDTLRYKILTDTDAFDHFITKEDNVEFVKMKEPMDIVYHAMTKFETLDVSDMVYPSDNKPLFPDGYLKMLNEMLKSEHRRVTYTDLNPQFGQVFTRPTIKGWVMRLEDDQDEINLNDDVTVVRTNRIFDVGYLVDFIKTNGINAVLVDSIDMVIALGCKVTSPMTFLYGTYRYNYENIDGLIRPKGIVLIHEMELKYHHEFGTFNPYGLISSIKHGPKTTINSN